MTVIEKGEAGKHLWPLGCAAVDADSAPPNARRRSRWLTIAVLAVVAGFFVATLAARWNDVISLNWRLEPWLFVMATVLLALSYGLVAWLWGVALHRAAGTRPATGARIWFLSNLARYVPGNVWSYVGAVELARREGVARRTTLAVMALTQVLSVGVALLVGLPVLLAERARLGRPALLGAVVVVVVAAGNTGYGSLTALARQTNVGLTMTINDPGNADLAITVGATHRDMPHTYGVSYFSSKGPTGDGRPKPDLVAPGERITSAAAGKALASAFPDGQAPAPTRTAVYVEDSGTSMAAPHVSGAVADFLSIRREFIGRPDEVKRIFLESATSLGRERYFQGHGLVDLMRAIQAI